MFENDYTFNGKHATYIKVFRDEAHLYPTYIDVYMNAAVFGLLHDRWEPKDNSSTDRARIYADAFAGRRDMCVFLYRLVMLLEKKTNIELPERIDRAFRDDSDEEHPEKLKDNLELFHGYVRGGIEVMFETFIDGCDTQDDYIDRAVEKMKDFRDELLGVQGLDKKLAELI